MLVKMCEHLPQRFGVHSPKISKSCHHLSLYPTFWEVSTTEKEPISTEIQLAAFDCVERNEEQQDLENLRERLT